MNQRSLWIFLLCAYPLFSSGTNAALKDQKNITAESGQNVTLPCRAPNKNIPIIVVEWSRADLEPEYVLLYRDEQFNPEHQHPSFVNRVQLQDRQMKDGDVSVILKDVMINDTGTYECRVMQRGTNHSMRANLKTEPISIISLRVNPPGPAGGEDKSVHLRVVVPLPRGVAAVAVTLLQLAQSQTSSFVAPTASSSRWSCTWAEYCTCW